MNRHTKSQVVVKLGTVRHSESTQAFTTAPVNLRYPVQQLLRSHSTALYSSSLPNRDTEDKPLVALVAWLGAKRKHFDKYVELWQSLGYPTYSIMPRTSSILIPPLGDRQAQRFLADLEQQQAIHRGRQLLLHLFSNAGFLFVGTALRLLAAHSERPLQAGSSWLTQADGIIFDSAPARLTPDISARGFTAAALGLPALGIEHSHPKLVAAARSVFTPVLDNPYISQRQDEIWQAWQTTAPISQQLYLYSAADALIPPQEVQRFQQNQVSRGVARQEKLWADSPHCEHFRKHPDEYRALIEAFSMSLQARS